MNILIPKKHLGQHFLRDENIARKIVGSLSKKDYDIIIEVGAGTGVLTKYLLQEKELEIFVVEVDKEAIAFLKKTFPELKERLIEKDFLKIDFNAPPFSAGVLTDGGIPITIGRRGALIGNFPYNISSQILFKILEYRDQIPEAVGMFQKEVAQRIASLPGNKMYGILSVLMQAYYKIEYLFTVSENVFYPPPKVKSAVLRFTRNEVKKLDCDEELFFKVVKTGFNQRRKTLRNALSKFGIRNSESEIFNRRAEQLSVNDFVELTKIYKEK